MDYNGHVGAKPEPRVGAGVEAHPPREHVHAGAHHAHASHATPLARLVGAFVIPAVFMVVEAGVGFWSKSLALVADAGHMLADAAALGLAIFAQKIASQSRTRAQTYGYRRAEVLAAFANGVALFVTALWIFGESVTRLRLPQPIAASTMTITAIVGLAANLGSAWLLSGGERGHNANTRAALAHVISDALGSVGAILAGVLVLAFGWNRADPVISIGIGVLVLWGGVRLVREMSHVLMEGSPVALDLDHLEEALRSVDGVLDFHDLHVWSISSGFDVLTVHVVIAPGHHGTAVVDAVTRKVRERFRIDHVTIQPEAPTTPALVPLRVVKREGD